MEHDEIILMLEENLSDIVCKPIEWVEIEFEIKEGKNLLGRVDLACKTKDNKLYLFEVKTTGSKGRHKKAKKQLNKYEWGLEKVFGDKLPRERNLWAVYYNIKKFNKERLIHYKNTSTDDEFYLEIIKEA